MSMNTENYRVLVTPTSFGRDDPELKRTLENRVGEVIYNEKGRPLTADELVERMGNVDGFIAGLDDISREVILSGDRLQVIARYGVGVDNVDLDAADERGIRVTNTPGANSGSVAELAVAFMVSLARHLFPAARATREGRWPRLKGISLEDKTVGLFGFGDIGRETARRLAGFGCRVTAYDIAPDEELAAELGVELLSREEVISSADFLSLHCSLVPATEGLVDEDFLAKMKPGAFLINTARGEMVDEEALLKALTGGRLAGAGLDVFAVQPPDPGNPLLRQETVLTTPHLGAHTDKATCNMGWGAVENCLAVLKGDEPPNPVN